MVQKTAPVRRTSPEVLRENVLNQLAIDGRLDAAGVEVTIEGTSAILTGRVSTPADRRIAEADAAAIPGIGAVENRLTVRHPEAGRTTPDAEIEARVRDTLRWNSFIDDTRLAIAVKDGVVALDGFVKSYWQKFRIQEMVEDITGVRGVDNDLTVNPLKSSSDDLIVETVQGELESNISRTPGVEFRVEATNGVVVLEGTVPDLSVYRAAESIAYSVSGVTGVVNNLLIQPVF